MTTGQLIKEARKKKQMTQKQLAEKLGISYVNISKWENNLRNPKYNTLKRIAAALGVNWLKLVPAEGDDIMKITKKYRKKPVIIEAYQTDKEIIIHTLEGDMLASVGDYIITGVNGEQYPCKPDIFEKTYEPVEV